MKIIDTELLDSISKEAKESSRLRMNYNLHENLDDKVQRLINAMEPGTSMPIHRHRNTTETYFLLRGGLRVLIYNEFKELVSSTELNPHDGKYGVHIPAGQWHSIEVLLPDTIIFEVKEGPYKSLNNEDRLD